MGTVGLRRSGDLALRILSKWDRDIIGAGSNLVYGRPLVRRRGSRCPPVAWSARRARTAATSSRTSRENGHDRTCSEYHFGRIRDSQVGPSSRRAPIGLKSGYARTVQEGRLRCRVAADGCMTAPPQWFRRGAAAPARRHDVLMAGGAVPGVQGFVDSRRGFVLREAAKETALEEGQAARLPDRAPRRGPLRTQPAFRPAHRGGGGVRGAQPGGKPWRSPAGGFSRGN